MAQAKQAPASEQSPPAEKPVADNSLVPAAVETTPALVADPVEAATVKQPPGMKRFRIEKPGGEVSEVEAATVEDAIRQLNSDARGKVFTYKSLKITEI